MDALDQTLKSLMADIKFHTEADQSDVRLIGQTIIRLALFMTPNDVISGSLGAALTLLLGRTLDPEKDNDLRELTKQLIDLAISKREPLRTDATNYQDAPKRVM